MPKPVVVLPVAALASRPVVVPKATITARAPRRPGARRPVRCGAERRLRNLELRPGRGVEVVDRGGCVGPSSFGGICFPSFGSPADHLGPVALRPHLTVGLPFR